MFLGVGESAPSRCAPSCSPPSGTVDGRRMTYNRMFTLHGVTMVWSVLDSEHSGGVRKLHPARFRLGARDLAFPRLNLPS